MLAYHKPEEKGEEKEKLKEKKNTAPPYPMKER